MNNQPIQRFLSLSLWRSNDAGTRRDSLFIFGVSEGRSRLEPSLLIQVKSLPAADPTAASAHNAHDIVQRLLQSQFLFWKRKNIV
jgi:hypothetical protein